MFFFVNNALNKQNSGIEHAQIQRAYVFDQYKSDYKLVYMAYNPKQALWLDRFKLQSNHIVNLFDYYQQTLDVPFKKVLPEDIFLSDVSVKYVPVDGKNTYLVVQESNNVLVGRINWYEDFDFKQVSSVERFDLYGNLYRVDEYDVRGFLSRSQLYTPDNKIYAYTWFDLEGKPVITQQMTINKDGSYVTGMFEVVDHKGYRNYYRSFRDVVIKFLNDLNDLYFDKYMPNIFVGDRLEGYEDAFMYFDKPAIKVSHIHNCHASDVNNVDKSPLNNYYLYDMYNNDQYDFYICATHKQAKDMRNRFKLPEDKVVVIPVGLVEDVDKVSMSSRRKHSVLVTARRAEEKRIDCIIEAVGLAQKHVPDITLDVYGYRDSRNNDAAKKKIDAMIKKYHLEKAVTINDYEPDLDKQRDDHQVYMVFSTMEGFNIALMEAQNHGEVAVVNNVNYGPNELVVDGVNGYIVDYNDVKAASKRLVELFTDDSLLQTMSNEAYKLSDRYKANVIADGWKFILDKSLTIWKNRKVEEKSYNGLEEFVNSDYNGLFVEKGESNK